MVGSAQSLLLQASKEVQTALQLLDVVYPLSNDPKVLMSVVRHASRALDLASDARGDLGEASHVSSRFHTLLDLHGRAETAFSRDERLVLAEHGFASLSTLTPAEVVEGLAEVKRFVHETGRMVMTHD